MLRQTPSSRGTEGSVGNLTSQVPSDVQAGPAQEQVSSQV